MKPSIDRVEAPAVARSPFGPAVWAVLGACAVAVGVILGAAAADGAIRRGIPEAYPGAYGSDVVLDILTDACAAGDYRACDDLYEMAPVGSAYEAFGDGCGDLVDPGSNVQCASTFGYRHGDGSSEPPPPPGSSPDLDTLWDRCARDDFAACDLLYGTSPSGSRYEELAATCNGRVAPSSDRLCADVFGAGSGAGNLAVVVERWQALYRAACEGGDMIACDRLYLGAPDGSGDQVAAATCGFRVDGWLRGACTPVSGAGERFPGLLGSDPRLDTLAAACDLGDPASCDALGAEAGSGTEYALVAATCGGRVFATVPGGCDVPAGG